jgi:hypothetical protein
MADIADHRAGRAVEIALAVDIPHVDAARLVQHRPRRAALVEKMAFCLVTDCGFSTGKAAQSFARNRRPRAPFGKGVIVDHVDGLQLMVADAQEVACRLPLIIDILDRRIDGSHPSAGEPLRRDAVSRRG